MAAGASHVTLNSELTLSYMEQGDGDLAVVLLPGPTDSWRSYQAVLEQMPLSIRTVAVSQRGHGDSGKPAAGYRVEDFAADVPSLLNALGIERAVLVGHSGSCLVARRVAIDHPDRVAGLVLEASPSTLHRNPRLAELVAVMSSLADPIDATFARSFLVETSKATLRPEVLDELVVEVQKVPAHVWRETFAELQNYDDLSELEQVAAPALLIWGDSDPIVGLEMQQQLLDRLPRARLIAYEGVGHTPRWEDPDRFAADLAAFHHELSDREYSPGVDTPRS